MAEENGWRRGAIRNIGGSISKPRNGVTENTSNAGFVYCWRPSASNRRMTGGFGVLKINEEEKAGSILLKLVARIDGGYLSILKIWYGIRNHHPVALLVFREATSHASSLLPCRISSQPASAVAVASVGYLLGSEMTSEETPVKRNKSQATANLWRKKYWHLYNGQKESWKYRNVDCACGWLASVACNEIEMSTLWRH